MSSGSLKRWERFWRERDDAGHRNTDDRWIRFYAAELMLYAPESVDSVIELGCGRGDLYPYVCDVGRSYVGLDFSDAMTAAFRRTYPAATIMRANATAIPIKSGSVDFVFCNQMAQYLDDSALQENMREVWRVLRNGGVYLIANVPDVQLRWAYRGGGLRNERDFSFMAWTRAAIRSFVMRRDDGIGLWHSRGGTARIGRGIGYAVETFSSASYEYRFHVLLTKPAT